jgi:hypothetical protein
VLNLERSRSSSLRRGIMKLHAHIVAATVGLLTLAGAPAVRAASPELRALVPFTFSAGNTTLAAGSYTVERASGPQGALLIRSHAGGVIFLARRGEAAVAGKSTRLVFHRYGDRYYLRQVWFHGTRGYDVPETPEERESAARARELALGPGVVTVIARLG